MNVVDSSAWLAYLAGTANAEAFAPAIEATDALVVPAITLYEVFKRVAGSRSETEALGVVAQMRLGRVVPVDATLAVDAAALSLRHRLPMADSLILATARRTGALLWTQDADFDGLADVRYLPAA